ncbi:MAG: type IV pili methyl-accepting chemotaxis transducer N-terminal domain-containing protein, partial [Mobilitalea sp.]
MNEFDYKKTYKLLIRRYLFASVILVILFVSRQIIIQYQINHEKNISTVINVSGRQRMLSQKIEKDMLMIVLEKDKEEISYFLGDLKEAINILKKSQNSLIHGNIQEGLLIKNSEVVEHLFEHIEPDFQNIIQLSNNFLEAFESNEYNESELYEIVKEAGTFERSFLEKMDEIVGRYDYEATKAINFIEKIELILFVMIVLAMLFIAIFVFLPIGSVLKTAFWEVSENNENLIKLFNTTKGALFVIKYDG